MSDAFSLTPKLTLWDRLLRLFGVAITWEWCLVGCTMGRHSWLVAHEKCRNGTPVISGWFLTVVKFGSEQAARDALPDFRDIAAKVNAKNGYHP